MACAWRIKFEGEVWGARLDCFLFRLLPAIPADDDPAPVAGLSLFQATDPGVFGQRGSATGLPQAHAQELFRLKQGQGDGPDHLLRAGGGAML